MSPFWPSNFVDRRRVGILRKEVKKEEERGEKRPKVISSAQCAFLPYPFTTKTYRIAIDESRHIALTSTLSSLEVAPSTPFPWIL